MAAYYNEIDSFCCRVLRKQIAAGNLPEGKVDERDVREVSPDDLAGFRQIHLFAGTGGFPLGLRMAGMPDDFSICTFGFPCQDISVAGKGEGIQGSRSGLFYEAMRIVREVRPDWLLIENVPALRVRGADEVLDEVEQAGYSAWACVVGAWAVGAPHSRDRCWIVGCCVADSVIAGLEGERPRTSGTSKEDALPARPGSPQYGWEAPRLIKPEVGGAANGLSRQLARLRRERLKALGNAVVPQVVQLFGEWILRVTDG